MRSTLALRSRSYAAKACLVSGRSRRHLESTTASSIAIDAPCPEEGAVACAASPMMTSEPLCQVGTDDLDGRRIVPGEEVHQHLPPLLGADGGELRARRLVGAGRVGEPPDLPGGMNRIAEERPLPEDHAERAGLGRDAHVAGVPADVEHRD